MKQDPHDAHGTSELPAEALGDAPATRASRRIVLQALRQDLVVLVRPTAHGVAVRVASASIVLRPESPLVCASMRLRATRDLTVAIGGDLRERASGSSLREAEQQVRVTARQIAIAATDGRLEVRANDDVSLRGDPIRLNAPEANAPPPLPGRALVSAALPVPPEVAPPTVVPSSSRGR